MVNDDKFSAMAQSSPYRVSKDHGGELHVTGDQVISPDTVEYLRSMRDDLQVPGVSIAVVRINKQTGKWEKQTIGLGYRDAEKNRVTDKSLFSIGSNSKLFTAITTGLALSRANKESSFHTPVREVIPSFHLVDKIAERDCTFIELLNHQTGLPRHELSYDADCTPERIIESLVHLKPSAPFRSRWQYNNLAYTTASCLPRQLFGNDDDGHNGEGEGDHDHVSFDGFVKENIFRPLGMDRSFYDIAQARETGELSSGFVRKISPDRSGVQDLESFREELFGRDQEMKEGGGDRGGKLSVKSRGELQPISWFLDDGNWRGNAGPGGIITCSRDMTVWLQTLLSKGTHAETGSQVIPSSIIEDTASPRVRVKANDDKADDPEISPAMYGLGQTIFTYRDHYKVIEHGGGLPGQKSLVTRLPDEMVGVAIMSNDEEFGTIFNEVARWFIVDDLLGLDPIDFKTRQMHKFLKDNQPKTPEKSRPSEPALPTGGFGSIQGTYRHPAYGDVELQPFKPEPGMPAWSFRAKVDKMFVKELFFEHVNGDDFKVTTKLTFPDANPDAVIWNVTGRDVTARFGQGGMGLQQFWGAGENVPNGDMEKDGVKDGSEVFFVKVH